MHIYIYYTCVVLCSTDIHAQRGAWFAGGRRLFVHCLDSLRIIIVIPIMTNDSKSYY